ncbi:hypothetical protein QYF61_001085 [Mycteria americana]|uniref:Uncharacterized protein n=1 Tax=Mycteria americana TaxID=33587 RepID=A0AAN7RJ73_MYCAM|nr:hypothetical protein QYF61_001085 [Mycteria americana]
MHTGQKSQDNRYPLCSTWRTPRQSRWMRLKEAGTLWRACAGAGSWQDLWTHEERSPCWSRFSGRTCDPVGDPCWSSLFLKDCAPWKGPTLEHFLKNCNPWEGLTLEKFVEDLSPVGETPRWSRRRLRRGSDRAAWWAPDIQPGSSHHRGPELHTVLKPVLHPAHCEPAHPTVGQLVQKDAVRDSIKSLTKIQKDYIHRLPFIH